MSFPTWSLPAKSTCPGCTRLCSGKCYARKAELAYPTVLPSRKRNLASSREPGFVSAMVALITAKAPRFFRVHESGDFYSQAYLERWFAICRACPTVRFLAFTKSFHLDFGNKPANLQVIWSVWPDTDMSKVPSGPRAYAGEFKARRKTLECPGGCDHCGMCWDIRKVGADVHFSIH